MSESREAVTSNVDPRVARSRQAILAAGVELLIAGGPNAVTVDAVVAASGVAKTTIYRHWPSRDDLLLDVFRTVSPRTAPPDASLGFVDALREALTKGADSIRDPNWRRALPSLLMLKDHDPHFTTIHAEMEAQEVDVMGDVLQRGVTEGLVRPSVTVDEFVAFFIGPMMFVMLANREFTDTRIDKLIDRFLASEAFLIEHGSDDLGLAAAGRSGCPP